MLAGIGLYFLPGRLDIQLSKDLIFQVFLPPLVFEAALYISWGELRKDLPVIGRLAEELLLPPPVSLCAAVS